MASTGSALKGVRTRFRNILDRELKNAKELLCKEVSVFDISECLKGVKKSVLLLKSYSEKLSVNLEKMCDCFSESEPEYVDRILDEDCQLNFEVENVIIELEQVSEKLNVKPEDSTGAVPTDTDKLTDLQEQMQKVVLTQMQQQQGFMEYLERKEKSQHHSTSVKLPKFDLKKFSGNKLDWCEFWDAFECTIHNNTSLSNIERFNYLHSKLEGEAKRAVAGIALSNENYRVAVSILMERFGNKQEVVDIHYKELVNVQSPTVKVENLRKFLDTIEKHLRSLEMLGESVDQKVFVSLIRSKLPEEVLRQLEFNKGAKKDWSIETLRQHLKDYVVACEKANKKEEESVDSKRSFGSDRAAFKLSHGANKAHNGANSKVNWKGKFQSSNGVQRYSAETMIVSANKKECKYCGKGHWSDECREFETLKDRKKKISGCCFRCLKKGHRANECKSNKSCVYCGEFNRHHRSLCPKRFKSGSSSEIVNLTDESVVVEEDVKDENVLVSAGESVLMQTARSEVVGPIKSRVVKTRLLMDCGSQRTYVSQELADKLGLKPTKVEELNVVTFGSSESRVVKTYLTTLSLKLNNGELLTINANIVPVISGDLQRRTIDGATLRSMDHLIKSLDLADTLPTKSEPSKVDLLIGSDYYLDLILSHKIEVSPGLYLLSSKLGWILSGRVQTTHDGDDIPNMLIMSHGRTLSKSPIFQSLDVPLQDKPDLEDFWRLDSIGIRDKELNKDDETAMKAFKQNIKFEDGRYNVTWPWKEENPELPENRALAHGRLKSCLKRLSDKPEFLHKYDEIIQDQFKKGVIEKVENSGQSGLKHYIPHHAVITPQKTTTKVRIVYDASAKTSPENKSLNECLYRGPVMLQDLCGLLMRFRLNKVVLVADIEKAFLQISLQPTERDVTRFLWIKDIENPATNYHNIQEYRFTRVPFGVISSPFLLGATIEAHLDSYGTPITEKLKNDLYVDNLITGASSDEDAIVLYKSAKDIFTEATMNLREWLSNSERVNEFIPMKDRAQETNMNVLGHLWNSKSDTIAIKHPKNTEVAEKITKRIILKKIASVFDPMGLFAPVILKGKVLLQKMWDKQVKWDEQITDRDTLEQWRDSENEIQCVDRYSVPRKVVLESEAKVVTNLLCFCDSSAMAYATAIYIHQYDGENSVCNLIFAKTRLAPVKGMTIPKLELMAVVVGVRCVSFVKEQLKIDISDVYVWTDSMAVIGWLNSSKNLPTFIRNRVREIKSHDSIVLSYVKTSENPADIATRGATVKALSENKLWWHGPDFVKQSSDKWLLGQQFYPHVDVLISAIVKEPEYNGEAGDKPPFDIDSHRFSSVSKIFRVTAYVIRFIRKLRGKVIIRKTLTSEEIQDAEVMWLKYVQRKQYPAEFDSSGKPTSLQKQLGVYVDNQGLLRCVGRLDNAELSEGAKHPLLLPPKEHVTKLFIERVHKECFHSGVSQTLARLRLRFWIPKGRSIVKSVIRQCSICRRIEGGPYKMPPMAPIPACRVTESTPFANTGVDYFGPLSIKSSDGVKKVWVCLFTCMVVRAVHLEIVQDMSSEEFILALKRFISQRGAPKLILSDNGAQFKLSSNMIDLIWNNVLVSDATQSYIAGSGIKWRFIVELAPWMGGFYERLVGVVKRSLRKGLGRRLLTLIQIQTLIKEIEAVVNSRPLVYVCDDVNSSITLTPSHFLTLNPNIGIPTSDTCDSDPDFEPKESSVNKLLKTWKKGQKLLEQFWIIWRNDYLTSLRERSLSKVKQKRVLSDISPSVGDVVLIKDNVPRGSWRLGKIISLSKSSDGHIRSGKVVLSTGKVLRRPISLLYPVESSTSETPDCSSSPTSSPVGRASLKHSRPQRKAAEKAKLKIKKVCKK